MIVLRFLPPRQEEIEAEAQADAPELPEDLAA